MGKAKREKILKILIPTVIFLSILFLCMLVGREMVYVLKKVFTGNTDGVKEHMDKLGMEGVFVLMLLQALQTITTVLPGEPIQVIAGLAYGKIYGTLICMAGIVLGGMVLYVLIKKFDKQIMRIFTPKKSLKKEEELEEKVKASDRNLIYVILVLYFLPAIPYGFICVLAATLGMRWYNLIWTTIIGTAPSIIICVFIGDQLLMSNYWVSLGLFVFFLIVMVVILVNKDKIINKVMNKKYKNHLDYIKRAKIRKPSRFYIACVKFYARHILKRRIKYKFKYELDINKLKKPFIVINNHGSSYDFVFANDALKHRNMNNLMAYNYFCKKSKAKLLFKAGCIPKYLFCPDLTATKRMLQVVKRGGILGLAPEGRLSPSGTLESVNPATVKLFKKMKLPVVNVHIQGAYLTKPKWSKDVRRGRIDITVSKLFEPGDFDKYSEKELSEKLESALYYDEFAWQKENNVFFKSETMAEGLENILYLCPDCGELFSISTEKGRIFCENCGMTVYLDNYYRFSSENAKNMPENIDAWYKLQKKYEYDESDREGYEIRANVTLKMPDPEGGLFRTVSQGVAVLNNDGLKFTGEGEIEELFFDIKNLETLLFAAGKNFELYSGDNFYYFKPERRRESVRFSVAAEVLHRKKFIDTEGGND